MEEPLVLSGEQCFQGQLPIEIVRSHMGPDQQDGRRPIHDLGRQLHSHSFVEIAYVLHGRGSHRLGRYTRPVQAGELYVFPIGVAHLFSPLDEENSGGLEILNCNFMPSALADFPLALPNMRRILDSFLYRPLCADAEEGHAALVLEGEERAQVEGLLLRLEAEQGARESAQEDMRKLLLCELLIRLYRRYGAQMGQPDIRPQRQELLQRAILYIRDHYRERLSLEEVAAQVFISRQHLARVFKRAMGMSVLDYIQHLRIQTACALLTQTDQTIAQIAQSVGYHDSRFFSQSFQRVMNRTPSAYRRETEEPPLSNDVEDA